MPAQGDAREPPEERQSFKHAAPKMFLLAAELFCGSSRLKLEVRLQSTKSPRAFTVNCKGAEKKPSNSQPANSADFSTPGVCALFFCFFPVAWYLLGALLLLVGLLAHVFVCLFFRPASPTHVARSESQADGTDRGG